MMDSFKEREQMFENKFAHDNEIEFKINMYAHKLLGMWAAEQLHMPENQSESYACSLVQSKVHSLDHEEIMGKIFMDLAKADIPVTKEMLEEKLKSLQGEASDVILNDTKH